MIICVCHQSEGTEVGPICTVHCLISLTRCGECLVKIAEEVRQPANDARQHA